MPERSPLSTAGRPIRVMHVIDVLALAGMEYGVIKVANRLDPSRVSVGICCLRFQVEAARAALDPRIPVFPLEERVERNASLIFKLARVFRRERIDIVHSHNWVTYFYTVLARRLAGVPIHIHGEHGHDTQTPSARRLMAKRVLAPHVTRFVAVSRDLADELVRDWRLRPERVRLITNGVDLEAFRPGLSAEELRAWLGIVPGEPVVVSVGGIRRVKDYPTLFRAFALVRRRHPGARLLIVGHSFYPELRAELDELARALDLGGAVIHAGVRRDVPDLLALSHVYVNSSLFEGMSNTILEAMAMGRPVVATNVGGNPELVTDGVTGFLVPPGDVVAIAERIEALLSDPALRASMGAEARAQVERRHRMESMVRANEELYLDTSLRARIRREAPARERAKRFAARVLSGSGALGVLRRVSPAGLTILTYHRVLPLHEARPYPFQGMVIARDEFEGQIAHLARRYRVLPLAEAVERLAAGDVPPRAVAITFDDGYQDNYEHALPLLRRYGLPATFFVVTDAVDGSLRFWWDIVAEAVAAGAGRLSREAFETLPEWVRPAFRHGPVPVAGSVAALVNRLNRLESAERAEAVVAIVNATRSLAAPSCRLALSWDEAREMARSGMNIGSHTRTHSFLDEASEAEALAEISGSLDRIAERIGMQPHLLAYPRGRSSPSLYPALRRAGLRAAMTTLMGTNLPGCELLNLKRTDVGFSRQDRGFDPSIFDAELAGVFGSRGAR